jgi:hypothetical protein
MGSLLFPGCFLIKKKEKYATPPKKINRIPPFLLLPHINPYHKKLEGETWNKAMQVDITEDSFVVVHWFGRMNCVLIAGSKLLFLLWIQ